MSDCNEKLTLKINHLAQFTSNSRRAENSRKVREKRARKHL